MLPTVGSAFYSHKNERARQLGVLTHTDRNDNYSSKKRPAVTIASSQPQAFRKKKVGFDAEQCGFLRINDIILTISGNVNKTYEHMSLNSDKTAFIKEIAFAKIQSQEKRVNWDELKKLNSSKGRNNGHVSEALASYLKASDRTETRREPIDSQLLDLDNIVKADTSSISFFSDSSINVPINQLKPTTGPTGLWKDLKKKGFKEIKHSKSLFEMLVPDDAKRDYRDLSTRRKSTIDTDVDLDNDGYVECKSAILSPKQSEVIADEQKYEPGKKNRKYVTIVEGDGKVHSPGTHRMSSVDEDEDDFEHVPSILITPASPESMPPSARTSPVSAGREIKTASSSVSVSAQSSPRASIISTGQENETGQVSDVSPLVHTKSRLLSMRTDPAAIAAAANIYQAAKDISDVTMSNNNSCSLTSSICISRRHIHQHERHIHQHESQMLHPVRLYSFSSAARHTGGFNLSSNKEETDAALMQWKLLQITVDIETLRRENCRLKRKIVQWTRSSEHKPDDPTSVFYDRSWRVATVLSCLTMIIIGIILGKFII